MLIDRISQMIEIRDIQDSYHATYGTKPYNVSSWLASTGYSQTMLTELKMPDINTIDYVYTYSMDRQILSDVKNRLDSNNNGESGITFVDNGTQAIITLVNLIKRNNFRKICIVNPAYFTIAQALKAFDIEYDLINVKRVNGQYVLPYEELVAAQYDVIWITSPLFSTSVYYDIKTVEMLNKIMDLGTLIISDECFCVSGHELIGHVRNKNNFIAIYSPHKSLCVNTFKFAAIIYPSRFDAFIEHWVDVLTGNLPASSLSAISHFLTPNYDHCLSIYKKFMFSACEAVQNMLCSKDNVVSDKVVIGSLMTLYFNNLSYDQIKSLSFMKSVIFDTGVAFYPSFLNGLDETFGFAFRINLALCDERFLSELDCLVNYLSAL